MSSSIGFIRFVFSTDATQAKGLLAFAPVGLPPTEHVCLFWTHCSAKNQSVGQIQSFLSALAQRIEFLRSTIRVVQCGNWAARVLIPQRLCAFTQNAYIARIGEQTISTPASRFFRDS